MQRAITVNFRSVFIVRFLESESVAADCGRDARPTDVKRTDLYVSRRNSSGVGFDHFIDSGIELRDGERLLQIG